MEGVSTVMQNVCTQRFRNHLLISLAAKGLSALGGVTLEGCVHPSLKFSDSFYRPFPSSLPGCHIAEPRGQPQGEDRLP